jgi:ubiquinone/menaquinone biosynthesis C-methylase UbiE
MKKRDYLDQADKSKHWEKRNSPASEYFEILKHYDKNLEGKTLLDVGCAEGVEVNEFRKLGLKADGVDTKEDFISKAQKRFPEANFVVGSAEKLPFKDQSYDIIFSINTLFYTDVEKSLPEFCRVLKKGGRGVVSFDTEIFNLDEANAFHSDSIEHLEKVLEKSGAKIEEIGEVEERIDGKPFRHKHTFHKVIFNNRSDRIKREVEASMEASNKN